jgi:hypothetical protein
MTIQRWLVLGSISLGITMTAWPAFADYPADCSVLPNQAALKALARGMSGFMPYAHKDAGSPSSLFPDYRSTVLRSPRAPLVRIPQTFHRGDWAQRCVGPADGPRCHRSHHEHKRPPHGTRAKANRTAPHPATGWEARKAEPRIAAVLDALAEELNSENAQ